MERRLVTFFLLRGEYEQFRMACEAEDKRMTTVLRDAVRLMIEKPQEAPDAAP